MVARTWWGATRADDAADYLDYLRKTGLAEYARVPGHRRTLTLRRVDQGRAEFLLGGGESGTHAQSFLAPADRFTGVAGSGICLGQFQVKLGLRGLEACDCLAQARYSDFQIGAVADLRDCYV